MTALIIICCYLGLLLGLGYLSNRFFRGTSSDYFLASRGIGPFFLLMSLFGTTMTAFALVGSSGEAWKLGIGVYGKMASWAGIIHSAVFFLIGIKLWSFGKRFGYVTQIQFFRDRFESNGIGLVLFPILVGLVVPYLLIGVMASGTTIQNLTIGALPDMFASTKGAIPFWLGSAVICLVVLTYVFFGGVRGTAWANAFQTLVFMILGVVAFSLIADSLGGLGAATKMVQDRHPEMLSRAEIPKLQFFTYLFIPLSVGMFPHLFQHWLTAKSARSFKTSVILHPILIMIVWVPCVLIGVWATSAVLDGKPVIPPGFGNQNAVLAVMVKKLTGPLIGGFLTAGVLAAIMSSLDSQFLCLGSIFTHDIVQHYVAHDHMSDRAKVLAGRLFVIAIVIATYLLALQMRGGKYSVFVLGVWCFSGFASLFPLVVAALYWRRTTKAGAYAAVLTTAITWILLFRAADWGKARDYLFLDMMPVATMAAATAVALIVVSLLTRPPSPACVEKFFGDDKKGLP